MSKRMEKWISHLIAGLDEHVDEETRAKVLEQCVRQCISKSFIKKARGIYEKSENIDEFRSEFGKVYKQLHREGSKFYIIYPRCYCSHVNKIPLGKLSATYSNCARG